MIKQSSFYTLSPSVRAALGTQKFVHFLSESLRAHSTTYHMKSFAVVHEPSKVDKVVNFINNSSTKLSKGDKIYISGESTVPQYKYTEILKTHKAKRKRSIDDANYIVTPPAVVLDATGYGSTLNLDSETNQAIMHVTKHTNVLVDPTYRKLVLDSIGGDPDDIVLFENKWNIDRFFNRVCGIDANDMDEVNSIQFDEDLLYGAYLVPVGYMEAVYNAVKNNYKVITDTTFDSIHSDKIDLDETMKLSLEKMLSSSNEEDQQLAATMIADMRIETPEQKGLCFEIIRTYGDRIQRFRNQKLIKSFIKNFEVDQIVDLEDTMVPAYTVNNSIILSENAKTKLVDYLIKRAVRSLDWRFQREDFKVYFDIEVKYKGGLL